MSEEKNSLSRRDFLKIAGVAGVAVQAGALVGAGVATGSSSETYTGWESFNPGTMFFDRTPFEYDPPAHEPVSEVRRPSHFTDYVFQRVGMFQGALAQNPEWTIEDPIEDLGVPPALVEFYNEFPERLAWDHKTFTETIPNNAQDKAIYGGYFRLADAYGEGWGAFSSELERPLFPPEISDYMKIGTQKELDKQLTIQAVIDATLAGDIVEQEESESLSSTAQDPPTYDRSQITEVPEGMGLPPQVPFLSPEKASEFVKEMAHRYGATLVRITKINHDFTYADGWRGTEHDYDTTELPPSWEYGIVIGVPMEWDIVATSPNASTSGDAYNRVSSAASRMEAMLKSLGYACRAHSPNAGYDVVVPPIAIDAGLGEVGRTGYCITPEVGGNCRTAVIATELPLAIDKPIDYGVEAFCNSCKLCAEGCPSGAISMADNPDDLVIRGYNHWYINNGACYNFWRESMGPMGCRLCVVTCPYSRKDNWVHSIARTIDPRDPTGLTREGLLWMQKNLFYAPEAIDYKRVAEGGEFATYRDRPSYLRAEDYLDIEVVKPERE
ncbi:4Fe-4S dicluster domain-containing protein [Chloroflexota bacterium]